MARGWESKSVEEQQSEFKQPSSAGNSNRTPEELQRAARLQTIHMQRARVREQLNESQNAKFIELMQHELEYLERELQRLEALPR